MTDSPTKGSLLVIFLTVFIDLLGFGMVLPLLPLYANQFTADESGWLIGLLMASFSAMQFLFAPLWGRLSDRIGRRPVLMIGLAGSVVFYTLFGLATVWQNIVWLFVARIGAGIAGATIPTAQAYIADTTTLETRAKGMALIGAAFGLGFTFGPLFGYLALPSGEGDPGPGPGFAAAGLSAVALALAWYKLPESLGRGSRAAAHKLFDATAWRDALTTPSIIPLLFALFLCVFAFANFETTLSMLVKGEKVESPFDFTFREVMLTFAYIGLSLTIAQGFLVRRLSTRVPEAAMAGAGAITETIGFWLILQAVSHKSLGLLFVALTIVVVGFALLMPSLNSLVSRRSDPLKQGGILGIAQSISSLARIVGPLVGIPLLKRQVGLPYWTAIGVMAVGFVLVLYAARRGKDYGVPQGRH
jgi:DHA1 family tetracycline resistance protein-like MFS transporter